MTMQIEIARYVCNSQEQTKADYNLLIIIIIFSSGLISIEQQK